MDIESTFQPIIDRALRRGEPTETRPRYTLDERLALANAKLEKLQHDLADALALADARLAELNALKVRFADATLAANPNQPTIK